MIDHLHITNLGIIPEADIDFSSGLTVLTGETGAGKTMALTSLLLLLGAKADASQVRSGQEEAVVEGIFTLPQGSATLAKIEEAGGKVDYEADTAIVVIRRVVRTHGRSRAMIGSASVATSLLKEIASELLSVHGQSDQIRLAKESQQRQALDSSGGEELASVLAQWREVLGELTQARAEAEGFAEKVRQGARERLAMEALLAKVDDVDPRLGEDEELKAEAQELENYQENFQALARGAAALGGDDENPGAQGLLAQALHAVSELQGDTQLIERLEAVCAEVDDIADVIAEKASLSHADPGRLDAIYSRRHQLRSLERALGMPLEDILASAAEARRFLEDFADPAGRQEELNARVARLEAECDAIGATLTALRTQAAADLATRVNEELPELALKDAVFSIDVTPSPERTSHGMDSVTFRFTPHPSIPAVPLAKGASGGELSRLMLALELVLQEENSEGRHTFLFDEVDSGVGGKAATSIGRRLALLGKKAQVIVVTHLAQVAAFADVHALIEKRSNESEQVTSVKILDHEARIDELARMLSGEQTEAARAHAAELLRGSNVAP